MTPAQGQLGAAQMSKPVIQRSIRSRDRFRAHGAKAGPTLASGRTKHSLPDLEGCGLPGGVLHPVVQLRLCASAPGLDSRMPGRPALVPTLGTHTMTSSRQLLAGSFQGRTSISAGGPRSSHGGSGSPVAVDCEAPPGEREVQGRCRDHGAAGVDPRPRMPEPEPDVVANTDESPSARKG